MQDGSCVKISFGSEVLDYLNGVTLTLIPCLSLHCPSKSLLLTAAIVLPVVQPVAALLQPVAVRYIHRKVV